MRHMYPRYMYGIQDMESKMVEKMTVSTEWPGRRVKIKNIHSVYEHNWIWNAKKLSRPLRGVCQILNRIRHFIQFT